MKSFFKSEPLYYSCGVDLIIITTISVLIVAINSKYLKDMNEDDKTRPPGTPPCLISDVMRFRTKLGMIQTPFYYYLAWILIQGFDLPDWFYHALCNTEPYFRLFSFFYFSSTSLIISLMRYVYIVHNQKVLEFGKETAKRMFYNFSVGVPMLLGALHAATIPMPPASYNVAHRVCNAFHETSYNMTCGVTGLKDDCNPVLTLVLQHVPSYLTSGIGILVKLIYILICTNVLDGFLYFKTFKMIRE